MAPFRVQRNVYFDDNTSETNVQEDEQMKEVCADDDSEAKSNTDEIARIQGKLRDAMAAVSSTIARAEQMEADLEAVASRLRALPKSSPEAAGVHNDIRRLEDAARESWGSAVSDLKELQELMDDSRLAASSQPLRVEFASLSSRCSHRLSPSPTTSKRSRPHAQTAKQKRR